MARKSDPKTKVAVDEELWFGSDPNADPAAERHAAQSMAAMVGRIVGAKPFPESARKLADLTRNDAVRIDLVVALLERDPALTARLLRLVNSAGYALRVRCTSVRHAATLVGSDRLHQLATTAAVLDMFGASSAVASQVIEHNTAVGALSRYVGALLSLPVDDLFTAGFLHDIGKLMLLDTEGEEYAELLSSCGAAPDALHTAERESFGFDHAVLAAHVLRAWNIPEPVPKLVAWHHDPTRAYEEPGSLAAMIQTLRFANEVAHAHDVVDRKEAIARVASSESASYLDISEPQVAAMWDEMSALMSSMREQCHGDNAPVMDAASLRPKAVISLREKPKDSKPPQDVPKQFACVVCGTPSFGETCAACHGHVCSNHQVGMMPWCRLCADEYEEIEANYRVPAAAKWGLGAAFLGVAASVVVGALRDGTVGALRSSIGPILLLSLTTVLLWVGRRMWLRARFSRNRPNRYAPAQAYDGGTQSLHPPPSQQLADKGFEIPSLDPAAPIPEQLASVRQRRSSSNPATQRSDPAPPVIVVPPVFVPPNASPVERVGGLVVRPASALGAAPNAEGSGRVQSERTAVSAPAAEAEDVLDAADRVPETSPSARGTPPLDISEVAERVAARVADEVATRVALSVSQKVADSMAEQFAALMATKLADVLDQHRGATRPNGVHAESPAWADPAERSSPATDTV